MLPKIKNNSNFHLPNFDFIHQERKTGKKGWHSNICKESYKIQNKTSKRSSDQYYQKKFDLTAFQKEVFFVLYTADVTQNQLNFQNLH